MNGKAPTPKQVAQKYWGNLGYFRKPHYLRQLRGWCFAITALCSIVGATTFQYWGSRNIFSKGPISRSHAGFANDCRVCHVDAEIEPLKALLSARPSGASLQAMFGHGGNANRSLVAVRMDEACLKCHASSALHLPQSASLAMRSVATDLVAVRATECFTCHREHTGHDAIVPPKREACASCHNDAGALRRSATSIPLIPEPLAAIGENRDLGDGLMRFLAPANTTGPVPPFADYARGHPPFAYEQPGLRDPADLKFNHARHERADVTVMGPNQQLGCADCHQPGPGGIYYQPVRYQRHCQECHSLQIQPTLPNLRIPHRDSEKVRYFLASLPVSIGNAVRATGITDPAELAKRVEAEVQSLRKRGLGTLPELEQHVFFDGDRKDDPNDRRMRTGSRKFLTECAKCHTVAPSEAGSVPRVNPPGMAERWVQRGPFTHQPHRHVDCADCHQGAHSSRLTADILMPPQKLCAECHRHSDLASPVSAAHKSASTSTASGTLAAAQRNTGGIKWDCQSCHAFHAPAEAKSFINAIPSPSMHPGGDAGVLKPPVEANRPGAAIK